MGIVISVALFLAFVMMLFNKQLWNKKYRSVVIASVVFIALAGVWNAAWYGVQNVPFFWGFAGLFSGLFMLASVSTFYLEMRTSNLVSSYSYSAFRLAIIVGLGLYFLLYSITIVQINLGLPIIY